jgi:solute carrier family 35 protein E1
MAESNTFSLLLLFFAWYAFNMSYNVYNSYLKVDLHFPIIISLLQLSVGLIYFIPLWVLGIRATPSLTISDIFKLLPIALLNAFGHAATVVAMFQVGGGSFTHVIKASEPVVSVILGIFINGEFPKPFTALSLLPITYGVAYASTLGKLDAATMSRELTTTTSMLVNCYIYLKFYFYSIL